MTKSQASDGKIIRNWHLPHDIMREIPLQSIRNHWSKPFEPDHCAKLILHCTIALPCGIEIPCTFRMTFQ